MWLMLSRKLITRLARIFPQVVMENNGADILTVLLIGWSNEAEATLKVGQRGN